MNMHRQIKKGDILFRQGDASDCAFLVRSGEFEVWREIGTNSVLLGHVRKGEWLGEMGVMESRGRSATVRACDGGEVEVLTAQQFLERVSTDPALARDLILRLSIRLRDIEDKLADDLLGSSQDRSQDETKRTALESGGAAGSKISISAESTELRALIGEAPLHIARLPFLIGRVPSEEELTPSRAPDLLLKDAMPFRLSRQHLLIAQGASGYRVTDLGSTLGTIVNGQAIGHHFPKDSAPLNHGENHIVAGGHDSPYKFVVTIN
jgi:CRP/FNR family transcriptional regulator, cyclic AMP receptor protein